MFKDKLTPKERMTLFSQGKEIDRLPLVPDGGVTMAYYFGKTTYEYYHSAKVMAETEIGLFNKLRHDSLCISTTLRGMAEAMGTKIRYPEDNISLLEKPVVECEEDIDKLTIIDPFKDGKLPLLLEALQIIRDRVGDEADIGASMTAPFSACASVVGTERLLKWMRKKPDAVHKVMDIVTRNNEEYIKALGKLGFTTGFCDPVSSTSLLKLEQFREFSLPYFKRNIEACHKYLNSKPTVHICGKSHELWEDLVQCGIGNFSIDNIEDLEVAKNEIGDRVTITGNVPPVDVMYLGKREDIFKSVKECIRKAHDSKCGYIVCTGCQIPKGTPFENIESLWKLVESTAPILLT